MIERPTFRPHYVATAVDDESVLLLSERKRILLQGALVARLAPLLDGARTRDEIAAQLAAFASRDEVFEALAALERKGYLAEAGSVASSRESAS